MASIIKADQWQNSAGTTYGTVLQVKQATQNQPLSLGVSGWVDVTGLSVSITPTAATSKFLILLTLHYGGSTQNTGRAFQIVRNTTAVGVGDGSSLGNINSSIGDTASANTNQLNSGVSAYLDSPATTSAITYKVQWSNTNNTMYLNRVTGAGSNSYVSTMSMITVMEIQA